MEHSYDEHLNKPRYLETRQKIEPNNSHHHSTQLHRLRTLPASRNEGQRATCDIREQFQMPFEDFRQKIRDQILTQRVIGQEVGSKINIPHTEIEKYYE